MVAQGVLLIGGATLLFALAFAVHVAVWRRSRATPSAFALVAVLGASILMPCLAAAVAAARGGFPLAVAQIAVVAALALELAACYVISYPALQATSPSLEIARQLARAGEQGLAPAQLYARLSEASLVGDRIDDLLQDGLALERDGRIVCTRRGATLARIYVFWKAVLGEPKGG
jgi:hypothetical protein